MKNNMEDSMANYYDCFYEEIKNMNDEEKGMLKCILLYGKKVQDKANDILNSADELKAFGADVTPNWVAYQLDKTFKVGFGVSDFVKNVPYNYGKQLDIAIKDVLIKALKSTKPMFTQKADSIDGAIQREKWITEKLMDSIINNMDEDAKQEICNLINEALQEKGIDPIKAAQASTALLTGGLAAAKAILGFQFHILAAKLANIIARLILGRGLSLAANAALQKYIAILFGPVGWIITGVLTVPLLSSLINKRAYDKFIPAIFIIGLSRIEQANES